MDALDIVMNKQNVIPYLQPIISADRQEITGYEVLGRYQDEESTVSLRPFFQDKSIPEEYRREIEEQIHHQALTYFLEEHRSELIFLNIDVDLILADGGEHFFERLSSYKEHGLSFSRLVLECKEHEFEGDLSRLKHFIQYVQSMGIRTALDDVGGSSTPLEEIAYLNPDIVKVDLGFLADQSFPEMYREALHSLSVLSGKIGASLLFENINEFNQLHFAWKHGARYFQGSYLGRPASSFLDKMTFAETLRKHFNDFLFFEKKKIEAQIELTDTLSKRLKQAVHDKQNPEDIDELTLHIAEGLKDLSFRVYLCNYEGFQQSGNAFLDEEGAWQYQFEEKNRNWSWRPYFLENIVRMNIEKKGILSDLYTDIHKEERIRTYSYPINENLYVFVDIPYSYLFEKDFLL
ncbi:EAL domain-containing protein [Salibacterium qingdaonense]|uniref:EAL domain, c-di-GMP-specific phosphodiesterase class I (Or its enzymatically inactive variant) n=1 Tax=Salibacterium qingdaonense TaxID=266892 RepID=A0A1I4K723_9BACI|nr:EAL-associated domain-containing protein [Salibacterium qingdaonense]SFL74313.1 EAL domain, c-di-GMP-specific phosphodiesterase class I (or its enzymatically inactive variant) [Salibacterium qingdaonense]